MRSTPHPTATATIRDLVRFANLPVDTDFTVFTDPSEPHGNLPGVDVASMLDGYSYHTKEDTPGRIRRGTVQAYGENVLAATLAFAEELAGKRARRTEAAAAAAANASDTTSDRSAAAARENETREAVAAGTGAGFFDVFGVFGVVYGPRWLAASLHFLPLSLCLLDVVISGRAEAAREGGGGGRPLRSYLRGARVAAASWGYAVALPASLGASRAVLLGRPLVWFGKPFVALALYLPPALVAVAIPYGRPAFAPRTRNRATTRLDAARGAALVTALAAALVGSVGGAVGYLPALWSVGVLAALRLPLLGPGGSLGTSVLCLACTFPAAALSAPVAYVTFTLLSEKVGIAGSEPWPLGLPIGDAIMGAVTGLLTALCTAGIMPFVDAAGAVSDASPAGVSSSDRAARKLARGAVLLAAAVWVSAAAGSSAVYPTPYSAHAPKRLAVLHQHDANAVTSSSSSSSSRDDVDGGGALEALLLVGAFDSVPAANALPPLHRAAVLRPTTREDFWSLYPVTQLLGEGLVLPSRPAARPPWGPSPPTLTVAVRPQEEEETQQQRRQPRNVVRVGVTFDIRAPAWSCARVTSRDGPVLAWSLSSALPDSSRTTTPNTAAPTARGSSASSASSAGGRGPRKPHTLWARHAGNGEGSRVWTFWMEVAAGQEQGVEVDAWALYPGDSDELDTVVRTLGDHVSPIVGTSYRVRTATLQSVHS